jgi:hypothetical protein
LLIEIAPNAAPAGVSAFKVPFIKDLLSLLILNTASRVSYAKFSSAKKYPKQRDPRLAFNAKNITKAVDLCFYRGFSSIVS